MLNLSDLTLLVGSQKDHSSNLQRPSWAYTVKFGKCKNYIAIVDNILSLVIACNPLSSTWPHLNSDVDLEEGEY